jgi:tetratricopeptide (TPR) repeat protein
LLEDRQYSQDQGTEYDDSSWIAEKKAAQHDWAAVHLYLSESLYVDVSTLFDEHALGGFHALGTAIQRQRWAIIRRRTFCGERHQHYKAYFPDFECSEGHAFAAIGLYPEALALLAAQRFVRCRAFLADALDASGNWSAAQQAYRAAEAVAPHLAFVYDREDEAFLRHGNATVAIERLRLAHHYAPHWAEPLKSLGDALLRLGRCDDALYRYHEARRWAPNWMALDSATIAARR